MTTRAVGAILLAGAILAGCGTSFNDAVAALPHATFEADVLQGTVSPEALTHVYVGYTVSNVGRAKGVAACTVLVDGEIRAHFSTHVLAAGASWYQVQIVSIPWQLGERFVHAESHGGTAVAPLITTQCSASQLGEH